LLGLTFEGSALPEGCNPDAPRDKLYTVTDIYPERVVLDGNHPLAGIAIRISLKVESVRRRQPKRRSVVDLPGAGFFRIQPFHEQGPGSDTLH
jgi:FKBP-type peptidyl-prolyl cis-trans isomerase SlyD